MIFVFQWAKWPQQILWIWSWTNECVNLGNPEEIKSDKIPTKLTQVATKVTTVRITSSVEARRRTRRTAYGTSGRPCSVPTLFVITEEHPPPPPFHYSIVHVIHWIVYTGMTPNNPHVSYKTTYKSFPACVLSLTRKLFSSVCLSVCLLATLLK